MLLHLPLCFGRGSFIDCCALHPGHWSLRVVISLLEVGSVKVGAAIAIVADGWLARGRILSHFGLPLWQALAGLTKNLPLLWSSLVAIVLCDLSVRRACTIFFCQSRWTAGRNLRVATFPITPRRCFGGPRGNDAQYSFSDTFGHTMGTVFSPFLYEVNVLIAHATYLSSFHQLQQFVESLDTCVSRGVRYVIAFTSGGTFSELTCELAARWSSIDANLQVLLSDRRQHPLVKNNDVVHEGRMWCCSGIEILSDQWLDLWRFHGPFWITSSCEVYTLHGNPELRHVVATMLRNACVMWSGNCLSTLTSPVGSVP